MNAIELLQRPYQHRVGVNRNLLTAAATLSDEQLQSSFPIGQDSVWKSLLHLYAAEHVWLEALHGNDEFLVSGDLPGKLPGNQPGKGSASAVNAPPPVPSRFAARALTPPANRTVPSGGWARRSTHV
jgi:hypothetical protein